MGIVGIMASVIEVVTLVCLILLAHTCQCNGPEDRLEETTGTERDSSVTIQNEIERAFAKKEKVLVEAFEERLSQLSSQFELREAEMKESLEAEMKESLEAEVTEMKVKLKAEEAEMKERLMTEVAATVKKEVEQSLRDVPDLIQCAYQSYIGESDTHKFVTFDRLITDYNSNNTGSFDLQTGRFEVAVAGYYTVTYSANVVIFINEGGAASLELWQNGADLEQIGDLYFDLGYGLDGPGTYFHATGSRSVILRMEEGDSLYLYAKNVDFAIDDLVMCVSMTG